MAPPRSWSRLTTAALAAALEVDPRVGLSAAEAARRLASYGPNALPAAQPPGFWLLVWNQFKSFIILLLLAAAVISWGLGERIDAIAIGAALLLNAAVGVAMDYRAERDLAALQAMTAPRARVRRDGGEHEIPTSEVVPGDLVLVGAGDRIPADARLIEGALDADESLLTGESVPVGKTPAPLEPAPASLAGRRNELFAGTLVTVGGGAAIVTATGPATEMGRIGALLATVERPATPLSERLDALGRTLVVVVGAVTAVLVAIGLWQGRPFWPLAETAVVLAIAAIPEGLPAVATLALAAAARRLARRGMLLRKLGALEALGAVDTLCLDKTGTLTANAMTVQAVVLPGHRLDVGGEGYDPQGGFFEGERPVDPAALPPLSLLLHGAQLCNDATLERHGSGPWHVHGDPSEGALLVAAAKAGLADPRGERPRTRVLAPGPGRPWMLVGLEGEPDWIKGAPEAVFERCASQWPAAPLDRAFWEAENQALAAAGLRVLAIARGDGDWELLGLVGMADPPRPGVQAALAAAHAAGVRTVMITGDQPATARAIAHQLGLAGGREPRVALAAGAVGEEADVYARVSPEGKFNLVRALEAAGHVTVMTGDGVNDAPALRAATVGVAMGQGADVAKEAASAVLTDQRLATLVAGVSEGRQAFFNIQRALDYLLTCSITTVLVVLMATAVDSPLPLLPLQILYLNLLTHTFPALGLAVEPASDAVLNRAPLPRRTALLPSRRFASILWHGLILSLATLAVGAWGMHHGGEPHGRTLAFTTLATALLAHTFADRASKPFGGWRLGRNPLLFLFVGAAVGLQLAAVYAPGLHQLMGLTAIELDDWATVLVAALTSAVAVELSKGVFSPEEAPRG